MMSKLTNNFSNAKEFLLYAMVGCLNSIVHVTFFSIMHFKMDISQDVANMVAFFLTVSLSYVLHGKVTFKHKLSLKKYCLFVLMLGSNAFLFGFIGEYLKIHPMVMVICFAILNLVLSFLGSKYWIYR